MRKETSNLLKLSALSSAVYWLPAKLALAEWKIDSAGEAPGFLKDTKVTEGIQYGGWLAIFGCGCFALACFMGAGNYARQGRWSNCLGAFIGGVIVAAAPWLVIKSQG